MKICACGHAQDVHVGGNVCQAPPCGCRGFRLVRITGHSEMLPLLTLPPTSRRISLPGAR